MGNNNTFEYIESKSKTHDLRNTSRDGTVNNQQAFELALGKARALLSTKPQLALDLCYNSEDLAENPNDFAKKKH